MRIASISLARSYLNDPWPHTSKSALGRVSGIPKGSFGGQLLELSAGATSEQRLCADVGSRLSGESLRPPRWTASCPGVADFTDQLTTVASRGAIPRDTLRRRLLLVLFALGTMGIKRIVSTGEHGETEAALRHVRRMYVTRENLWRAVANVANATLAARDVAWWGRGTACTSDSDASARGPPTS